MRRKLCAVIGLMIAGSGSGFAQQPAVVRAETGTVPSLQPLAQSAGSRLRWVTERFVDDRAALMRRYDVDFSPARRTRLRQHYNAWRAELAKVDFSALDQEARIDYVLLDHRLRHELDLLNREDTMHAQMQRLVPFAQRLTALQETRRQLQSMNAPAAARTLSDAAAELERLRRGLEQRQTSSGTPGSPASANADGGSAPRPAPAATRTRRARGPDERVVAYRAAAYTESLRRTLERWYRYYAEYDPTFTWWTAEPYKRTDAALTQYVKALRERVVGIRVGQEEPIIGDPIGSAAILADLQREMIAYTPEQLVQIAEREFAWTENEMKRAARDMGFGDNWRAALEKVKNTYVQPGQQPDLIRDMALEATEFVERRNLVTVPPLAKEIWRMEMLSPEAQRISPFFLGGEYIQVAFPTEGMSHEDKMMTMRGNNPHFSRAVVHHELIPGHHLQGFMNERYNSHRNAFRTPFATEGWALYWEMLLWDRNFPRNAEDRVGMLFWRAHRSARIIFSLRFHLGTMTPQEAIDFLVDRVGHERANAAAEVRRSFIGTYPPLYQVAYMIGGLQYRALYNEIVGSKRMTERDFHDAILQSGPIPVEMIRARLLSSPLTRDHRAAWRFAGALSR